MVFQKGPPVERRRSFCLERIRIEARMARFGHAAARTTKEGGGNRRSQRHSVYSGPYRFRRRPVLRGKQNSVNPSLAWLRGVGVAIGLCSLAFTSCNYDVPITSGPTRQVQDRLPGDWTS